MKFLIKISSFFVVFLFLMSGTMAETTKIRVVTTDFPLFQDVITESGRGVGLGPDSVVGLSADVVFAVLEKAGLEPVIESHPWPRTFEIARTEPDVLIFTVHRSSEREEKLIWIGALEFVTGEPVENAIYSLDGPKFREIMDLQELKGHLIAVSNNDAAPSFLESRHGFVYGEDMLRMKGQPDVLAMLEKGRVEYIAGSFQFFRMLLNKRGDDPSKLKRVALLFNSNPYFALSKGSDPRVVERIQTAFDEIVESGEYERITSRWR